MINLTPRMILQLQRLNFLIFVEVLYSLQLKTSSMFDLAEERKGPSMIH